MICDWNIHPLCLLRSFFRARPICTEVRLLTHFISVFPQRKTITVFCCQLLLLLLFYLCPPPLLTWNRWGPCVALPEDLFQHTALLQGGEVIAPIHFTCLKCFLPATLEIKAVSKNIVHVNQRFPSESNIFLVMELRVYLIQYILKFLLHDSTVSRCGQSLFVVHDNRWFLRVFCSCDSTMTAVYLNNWTTNKQCHNCKPISLMYCNLYIEQPYPYDYESPVDIWESNLWLRDCRQQI